MTDGWLMDADCIHGTVWYECDECDPHVPFKPPTGHLQATQTVETPTDSPTNGERKP